jgi:DNA-binding protein Fis
MPEHLDFLPDAPAVPAPGPARTAVDAQGLPRVDLPEAGLDLEALNRKLVRAVLQKFGGNKTRAAQYLGLSRYALHRRLQKE